MKKIAKLQIDFQKRNKLFEKNYLPSLLDNLIVGQKFGEDFKNSATYYTSFGFDFAEMKFNYPLVALLEVNNRENSYHRTSVTLDGQMFVAVFMRPSREPDIFMKMPMYEEWAKENPVTLYFLGCDDGSYSKQFKTEEEALAYIKKFTSLEEVIDDNQGAALFEEMKKDKNLEKDFAYMVYDSFLNIEN